MCKRVERICQVDPEGWYAPIVGEELVRCKDCAKYTRCVTVKEYYYCNMTGALVKEDDFCSWAERKADADS